MLKEDQKMSKEDQKRKVENLKSQYDKKNHDGLEKKYWFSKNTTLRETQMRLTSGS